MPPQGSVSNWIGQVRQGEEQAAAQLWRRYFHRLVVLARTNLRGIPRRAADEEDVVLSAFDSFFRGAEQGHFPDLEDRDGLWRLLITLTVRKAAHLRRDERRQKRGGGAVLDQAALAGAPGGTPDHANLAWVVDEEPTPAFAVQVAEECERLLGSLPDSGLRSVAVSKMEGYTNQEIADRLGYCLSTVERRLQVIRRLWAEEDPGDAGTTGVDEQNAAP
jgi:DNA-directed RNA polymerase specialized sigma24 family protein